MPRRLITGRARIVKLGDQEREVGPKEKQKGDGGACQYGRGKRRRQELHNEAAELIQRTPAG